MQVERHDFSNLPPGYRLHEGEDCNGEPPDAAGVGGCLATEYWSTWYWVLDSEDDAGPTRRDRSVAIADAWAHYKARNDPPGMLTRERAGTYGHPLPRWLWGVVLEHGGKKYCLLFVADPATQKAARAAAWAWYERRLALADQLDRRVAAMQEAQRRALAGVRELQPADLTVARLAVERDASSHLDMFMVWPRLLTWTDEQVAEVEHSAAKMPEVLGA